MPPASPTPTALPTPPPTPTGTVQPPVIPPTPKPLTRRSQQLQAWSTAAQRGRESIQAETNRHRQLAATRGIGAYYGDHSDLSRLPKAAQDAWIQTHLVAGSQAPALHESSCIGWAMMHVAAVYAAAGQGARW
jgi:hypothetical protein